MELIKRPRRLRGSANLRKMVRETRMDKSSLIYPLFCNGRKWNPGRDSFHGRAVPLQPGPSSL